MVFSTKTSEKIIALCFALLLFAVPVSSLLAQEFRTSEGRSYSLLRPETFPDEGYRLIVFLHGSGGNEHQAINLLKDYGPAKGYVVAGPASEGKHWKSAGSDPEFIYRLIKELQEEFDVPPERTLVLGYSAGGAAVYFYFLPRPDLVDAICAVNGFLPSKWLPSLCKEKKIAILALTGERDWNRKSVDQGIPLLKAKGYSCLSGHIKGARHGYAPSKLNPIILRWFEKRIKKAQTN